MTFDEFLAFEGEPNVTYEFENGRACAMAALPPRHQRLLENLASAIRRHLTSANVSLARMRRLEVDHCGDRRVYTPDLVASFEPLSASCLRAPRLIVEINSPGVRRDHKEPNVPLYGNIPTAEEIWLLEGGYRSVTIWSRAEGTWQARLPYLTDMKLVSPFLNAEIAFNDLYTGIEIDEVG